jgi:hypothetical protein
MSDGSVVDAGDDTPDDVFEAATGAVLEAVRGIEAVAPRQTPDRKPCASRPPRWPGAGTPGPMAALTKRNSTSGRTDWSAG